MARRPVRQEPALAVFLRPGFRPTTMRGMANATCPKCQSRFPIIDGQSIICPGCGAKFKPARKSEAVTVPAEDSDDMPPSYTRESMPVLPPPVEEPVTESQESPFAMPPIETNRRAPVVRQHLPSPRPISTQYPVVQPERTSAVAKIFWLLFSGWVAICILGNLVMIGASNGAMQEAVVAAETCVFLIAGYVFCRAIDSITKI